MVVVDVVVVIRIGVVVDVLVRVVVLVVAGSRFAINSTKSSSLPSKNKSCSTRLGVVVVVVTTAGLTVVVVVVTTAGVTVVVAAGPPWRKAISRATSSALTGEPDDGHVLAVADVW